MSNLNPFHRAVATKSQELATVKVQTAVYGAAIPVIYGTARVPGNLAWYGDFQGVAHTSKQAAGGKGGTAKVTNTTYSYYAAILLAVAHGPIAGIGKAWRAQAQTTFADLRNNDGWSLFLGTHPQAVWSYLSSKHAAQAIPYDGIAYVANPHFLLDSSASIGNWNWEVTGLFPSGGAGGVDANPRDVITDVLTNATYGMGWASALLADFAAYATYCQAMGLYIGLAVTSQQAASQLLTDLLAATNTAPVWSQGQLKLIPYADSPVTGNGVTFTPDTTPLYDLTDDDFLDPNKTGELVQLTRVAPSDVDNCVRVEYEDRANDYNKGIQPAQDDALVGLYGERDAPTLQYHFLHDAATTRTVAQLRLQRTTSVLNAYAFKLGWRYVLLEPMDLVTITDAALGLDHYVVRITSVEEDEHGMLSVMAEDWPDGIATATLYPHQEWAGSAINTNAPASGVATPLIFEAPPELTESGQPELWIAASGVDGNWGGADVWMGTDDTAFQRIGVLHGGSCYGVTTAALAAYAGAPALDVADTLAVSLIGANDQLGSGTDSDVAQAVTLCYVDGEFLAFKTATLTGAGEYSLTTLNRALYNSPSGLHPLSSGFARCDQALLRVPFPQGKRGQTLYFKFTSFNPYGGGEQQLADVAAYTHTFIGATDAPLKPTISDRISSAGVVDVLIDGHEYANETRVVIRTDRAPTTAEILASAFTTGTGIRNGTVAAVATVPPHTGFWIGAISLNADGVAGDPEVVESEWLGIGATPLPLVSIGTPVVQAHQIGFPITLLGSCRRVDLFALPFDADPAPGAGAVDCESLVPETFDYFEVGERGVQIGVPFVVNVPLLAGAHWINLTAVPTDALHQRGLSVSAKAQGPGSSPPAAPGTPSLSAPSTNANTATTTVTAPSSGAAIATWRLYADGKVLQDVTCTAGPGGTQSLSFGPFDPSTSHQLQVSGLTSGGVEGPLSAAVTATTTANTSGGGGGTGINGKLPTPTLSSGSFSRLDQAVSLVFAFGSGTPGGSNIEVVVLEGTSFTGAYTETGYTGTASPAVVDVNQSTTPQTKYYKLLARDPYGRYVDSDQSGAIAVNIPAGSA